MRFPFGTNDAPGYVERKGCAAKAIVNGNSLALVDPSAREAEVSTHIEMKGTEEEAQTDEVYGFSFVHNKLLWQ